MHVLIFLSYTSDKLTKKEIIKSQRLYMEV